MQRFKVLNVTKTEEKNEKKNLKKIQNDGEFNIDEKKLLFSKLVLGSFSCRAQHE